MTFIAALRPRKNYNVYLGNLWFIESVRDRERGGMLTLPVASQLTFTLFHCETLTVRLTGDRRGSYFVFLPSHACNVNVRLNAKYHQPTLPGENLLIYMRNCEGED